VGSLRGFDWAESVYIALVLLGAIVVVRQAMALLDWALTRVAYWWLNPGEIPGLARIADVMEEREEDDLSHPS